MTRPVFQKLWNLDDKPPLARSSLLMARRLFRLLRLSIRGRQAAATDEELVARIQRGDQQAWSDFLERYTDLLYGKAREYSHATQTWLRAEVREDEVAELYLFMAEILRRSFKSFRSTCKPRTWVFSIISNRPQVIKAYLLHKNPGRADVRIPRVLQSREPADREIFKRLVWGLEPAHIAQELDVPEARCFEVESLLAAHSPRVHARILANRQAHRPSLRLDASQDDGLPLQLPHPGPDPAAQMEQQDLREGVQEALTEAVEELTEIERRVLILLYNKGFSASQIATLSSADSALGLDDVKNVNRVYYLKDRALDKLVDKLAGRLREIADATPPAAGGRRQRLKRLEAFLQEQGVPLKKS